MKLVISIIAFLVFLFALDWQQRWRAENVMKEQGRFSDCRKESPCVRRSVEADICSILSNNRSFLGRTVYPEIDFKADRECGRGGHYDLYYWIRIEGAGDN
tara:strand:+ start:494 stop:796 length:303 start_codon:yes stop_codon:yes gene_type:complete